MLNYLTPSLLPKIRTYEPFVFGFKKPDFAFLSHNFYGVGKFKNKLVNPTSRTLSNATRAVGGRGAFCARKFYSDQNHCEKPIFFYFLKLYTELRKDIFFQLSIIEFWGRNSLGGGGVETNPMADRVN